MMSPEQTAIPTAIEKTRSAAEKTGDTQAANPAVIEPPREIVSKSYGDYLQRERVCLR